MEVLHQAFESLGFSKVATILGTGNLVFETKPEDVRALERKIERKNLASETDGFLIRGREIYWRRRKKPGTSLYSTVPLTKVLTEPFTIRSTNTMRGLAAKWP